MNAQQPPPSMEVLAESFRRAVARDPLNRKAWARLLSRRTRMRLAVIHAVNVTGIWLVDIGHPRLAGCFWRMTSALDIRHRSTS